MINKATADLQSPSIRVRWFGGRTPQDLAEEYPILPVESPGLPVPGPNFVGQAYASGDPPPPPRVGKKKVPVGRPDGAWLTGLVRQALYVPDTQVTVGGTYDPDTANIVGGRTVLLTPGVTFNGGPNDIYGPLPAHLVVVGKTVNGIEAAERRPFCSPTNMDLWRAWAEAGLPTTGSKSPSGIPLPDGAALPTFLTNIARFAPSNAEFAKALAKDVVADGLHLLWQELAVCRPRVVLLLGGDAVKAVLGRTATISDYRGRVTKLTADFAAPGEDPDPWTADVVVCDSPGLSARDPDKYPVLLAGMRLLARTLGFGSRADAVPIDYQRVMTLADLEREVAATEAASANGGYVAFDCEWDGAHHSDPNFYLYTVQWSHAPGHARVAFLRRCGGALNEALPAAGAVPLLNRLLRGAPDRAARLVGHFAKADLAPLKALGVDLYPVFVAPRDDQPDRHDFMTGADKTYFEGAFDTYVAGKCVDELRTLKLEVMVSEDFGADRYDAPITAWKAEYCKRMKIRKKDLSGYGNVPEDTIFPYAAADADFAGREYLLHNGDPRTGSRGLLDKDRCGLSSRRIFATRMRAWAAVAEMEWYGMRIDRDAHRELSAVLVVRRQAALDELRAKIAWPAFDPAKKRHLCELLFGETFSPNGVALRPQGAQSLYLTPYKATETTGGGRLWAEAEDRMRGSGVDLMPSTDKETLTILSRQDPVVGLLLDIVTIGTALKGTFRPPDAPDDEEAAAEEDDPEEHYSAGLMSNVRHDGRVRTMIGFVETGRMSSSKPNLQNCFPPYVEILTKRGWVQFSALTGDDKVAQFRKEDQSIDFVKPLKSIRQNFSGDLVRIETPEQIRLTMTPDHRCLTRRRRGSKGWYVTEPKAIPTDVRYYQAGNYAGGDKALTEDEVTLLCSAQADGSWTHSGAMRFGFKKTRKVKRLKAALDRIGCPYTEKNIGSRWTIYLGTKSCKRFLNFVNEHIGVEKRFGPWVLDLDVASMRRMSDELVLWDGLSTRGTEYYSTCKENTDWVQALWVLCGLRATPGVYAYGANKEKELQIVRRPSRGVPYSMTTGMTFTDVPYVGDVHCVSVPSGFIVVREEGRVSVTGNCGSATDELYSRLCRWGEWAPEGSPDRERSFTSRSVFVAEDGYLFVDADLMGAEISAAGWFSDDQVLIDHARRSSLPKKDPNYLDLHSDLAKSAFHLDCSMAEVASKHKPLRVAAKRARFGHYYGASPDTIHRQCLLDSPHVTLEQVQAVVRGHDLLYPMLTRFFANARRRVRVGWMMNGYGGIRRFRPVASRELEAAQERAGQNWTCQGLVADHICEALGKLWYALRDQKLRSRIVLAVHDSIVMECPYDEVEFVHDELLPWAMGKAVPVVPTDFDGTPTGKGSFTFGTDVNVYRQWGVKLPNWRETCKSSL